MRSARRLDGRSYGRAEIFLNNERGLEIPRGKLAVGGASLGCRKAERGKDMVQVRRCTRPNTWTVGS